MGSDKKQSPPKKKKASGAVNTSPSSSKWKTPLVVALLALALYRAIEYHNYWNSLSPVVQVEQGAVQGRAAVTDTGADYFAFQGIPYAAPPVGPLRFQHPAPPASWAPEVRDARDDGAVCMQPPLKMNMGMPKNVSAMDVVRFLGVVPALVRRAIKLMGQSEDCLHVNVYTTKVGSEGAPLPVVVYFHGGAFLHGDNGVDVVGPQYMVEQGVVLVTAKYRLGPLGFLALGEAGRPLHTANAGLADAVAALRWVRNNIARFGGDPNKVTVMGQSAGGALAHYLTLVPAAKGLLHQAIAMSGTALHHWAYSSPQKALERTRVLVRRLLRPEAAGGPNGPVAPDMQDPDDVLRYLREVDARHIVAMDNLGDQQEESRWLMDEFPFQPTADGALLPAPPLDLIRSGRFHQVPLMLGLTAHEGYFAFMSAPAKNVSVEELMANVERDFHLALPEYMRDVLPRGSEALRRAEAAVQEFYFGKKKITQSSIDQFVDFYGTLMFELDTHRVMTEVSAVSTAPVFAYNFTYSGRLNMFKRMVMFTHEDFRAVSHCDELNYLFQMDILPHISLKSSDPEFKVRENIISLFTNFVKTGNPTPSGVATRWRQVTKKESPILQIDVSNKVQNGYKPAHFQLWNKFYNDFKI